jgi:phosphatidate cytidylyltransferase
MGNFKHLGRRFLVTLFGIPLLLGSMIVGKSFFLIITGIIVSVALWELYLLAEKKGLRPLKIVGIASALAIAADFYYWNAHWFQWILFLEWFLVLTIGLFQTGKNHMANAAVTLGGTLYLSCFSFFVLLRQLPVYTDQPYEKGGLFIMMVFIAIWVCDTAAYFVGSSFGKHPLFRRVSPRKTWEGAVAGFVFSFVSVWAFERLFMKSLGLADILFVGFVVGTVGQMSDLIESLFKRDVDVKDSSNLLPGHGGMLDRFDSPLLVAPVLYFYLFLKYFLL